MSLIIISACDLVSSSTRMTSAVLPTLRYRYRLQSDSPNLATCCRPRMFPKPHGRTIARDEKMPLRITMLLVLLLFSERCDERRRFPWIWTPPCTPLSHPSALTRMSIREKDLAGDGITKDPLALGQRGRHDGTQGAYRHSSFSSTLLHHLIGVARRRK